MLYLEDPESIEDHGGFVPGGVLLWGPPGTGKTLMAEAVAGETGKPYVFVDPGAFINMFFGVGILKVKSLFRQAAQALRPVRRGDRVLRRGRLAGQPRRLRRRPARPGRRQPRRGRPARCLPRLLLPERGRPGGAVCPGTAGRRRRSGAAQARPVPPDDPGGHGRQHDGHGHAAGAAHRAVGPEEAARLPQPGSPALARHEAQAAAQVPDPGDDGHEHAERAGPGAAAARPDRPHVPGRLPVQGGPQADLRGLLREGPERHHARADRPPGDDHALRHRRDHQGPGQRVADHFAAGRPYDHHLGRRHEGQAGQERRARPRASSTSSGNGTRWRCTRPATPSSATWSRSGTSSTPPRSRRAPTTWGSSSRSRSRSSSPRGAASTRPTSW